MNTHLMVWPRTLLGFDGSGKMSLLMAGLWLGSSGIAFSAGSTPVPETKTHTLFMGADFDVEQNHQFQRVQDVAGDSFVVRVKGEEIKIPMNRGSVSMKVQEELKLTESAAVVADFKTERAYTPGADPQKKFLREQPGTALMDQRENAEMALNNASRAVSDARRNNPGAVQAMQNQLDNVTTSYNNANIAVDNFSNSSANYAGRMEDELARELFDAMEIKFTVSSPKPLTHPYLVVIAQYRGKDEAPGTAHSWIFAKELQPIDDHPRKERFLQGGLPPGFALLKYELHLYDHGEELATNVSSKRVALTRDEAFEYIVLEYLEKNKGATLSAVPVMGQLPPDLYSKLSEDQVRASFYVKVDQEGMPVDVYSDEACTLKVTDPYIQAVIGHLRFKPALQAGKAVIGTARVRFNHLSLQT